MSPRHRAEYAGFRLFSRTIRALPLRWSQALCVGVVRLGLLLGHRYRHLTLQNLRIVFPELSDRERYEIARRSFIHLRDLRSKEPRSCGDLSRRLAI